MMKQIILFIIILLQILPIHLAAQKRKATIFDHNTLKGKITGLLVGQNLETKEYYYYKKTKSVGANVIVFLPKKKFYKLKETKVADLNPGLQIYKIELSLEGSEITRINPDDDFRFGFEFYENYPPYKVFWKGKFLIRRELAKKSNLVPANQVDFEPGFLITAPAELSILLINEEIEDYLSYNSLQKKYDSHPKSNYTENAKISIDNVSRLDMKVYKEFTSSKMDSLSELMSIYRYCNSFLDSLSFYRYEGKELKSSIDSLQQYLNNLKSNDGTINFDSVQTVNSEILFKKDVLVKYEKTIARLQFLMDKVVFIIRKSYLDFQD